MNRILFPCLLAMIFIVTCNATHVSIVSKQNTDVIDYGEYELQKRAFWSWIKGLNNTGVMVAITAGWMGMSVVLCAGSGGVPCAVAFVMASIYSAITYGIAAHKSYGSGLDKRNGDLYIFMSDYAGMPLNHINDSMHKRLGEDQIDSSLQNELGLLGISGYSLNTLTLENGNSKRKRDSIDDTSLMAPQIVWIDNDGLHSAWGSANMTHNQLISEMVASRNNNTATKRSSYQGNWASYNYDGMNYGQAERWAQHYHDGGDQFELRESLDNWINNNSGWKYCLSAMHDDDTVNYDDISKDSSTKGELYFNQFGGVDGECKNGHDGAQML